MPTGVVIVSIFIGLIIFILFRWAISSTPQCPKCKKGYMVFNSRKKISGGKVQITEICSQCGHIEKRIEFNYSHYYENVFNQPPLN